MRKDKVIRRLESTIKKLKQLPAEKFNYTTFVSEGKINKDGHACGTVCCVAGWYPTWFKNKVELKYEYLGNFPVSIIQLKGSSGDNSITYSLGEYHGINFYLVDFLFYGNMVEIYLHKKFNLQIFKTITLKYKYSFSIVTFLNSGLLTIRSINGIRSTKTEVTEMFELIKDLIRYNLIQYNYTKN